MSFGRKNFCANFLKFPLDFWKVVVYNFPARSMDTQKRFVQLHKWDPGAWAKVCAVAQKFPGGLTNLNARRGAQSRRDIIPYSQGFVNSHFAQISHKNFVHLHKKRLCKCTIFTA
jgi:hypothetical protein